MRKFIAVGFLFYIWAYLISINAQISSFPSSSGSVSQAYSTIQDEGSSLTQRNTVNFSGSAVSCVDNSGSARTDCTIAGGTTSSQNITDLLPTKTSSTVINIATGLFGHGTTSPPAHPGTTFTINSFAISNCTNASPIVCTVPSLSSTSLRNGDSIMITGVVGNTAANGTWVVEVQTATTIALNGSTGNGAYVSGGTLAGTGSGTAVIYGTPQGYVNIIAPASAGLLLTCSSTCVMNQATTPEVPSDGLPIASVTIVSGAWGTVTDTRRFLNSGQDVQAGDGITVTNAAGTGTVAVDSTVARATGTNVFTGANSFSAATRTAPNRTGSGAPSAPCTTGDTYFRTSGVTAGQNLYICSSTDTWTQTGTTSGNAVALYTFPFGHSNGGSGQWDYGFNLSDTMVLAQDVSGGACSASSLLAECGIRWYSLADATQRFASNTFTLPSGWTSGTITFSLSFGVNNSTDPVWKVKTKCYTSGSTPPAYNSSQTLPSGSVSSGNSYTRTISLTTTGCAGGRPMTIQLTRDDTSAGAFAIPYIASVEVQIP